MQTSSSDTGLMRPKLDATLILEVQDDGEIEEGKHTLAPLFALVSLNAKTAPSVEIPWSQLLALNLQNEAAPTVLACGRHKDCNLQVKDSRVSLRHFEIVARQKSSTSKPDSTQLAYDCSLRDCSSNGTKVNGKPVAKGQLSSLRSGDEISVLAAQSVGEEHKIAFVFRNSSEIFDTPDQVRTLDLDELVLCPICMQPIYKCIALMPCLHNFCMACYSDWMLKKGDCPVCRQQVSYIVKNRPMEAIIEAFLKAMPERRRGLEELREMDARDTLKLGSVGKVVRSVCSVANPQTSASSLGHSEAIHSRVGFGRSVESSTGNSGGRGDFILGEGGRSRGGNGLTFAPTNDVAPRDAPSTTRPELGSQICRIQ